MQYPLPICYLQMSTSTFPLYSPFSTPLWISIALLLIFFLSYTYLFCTPEALPVRTRCSDVLRPLQECLQHFSTSDYLSLSLSYLLQPQCVKPLLPPPPPPPLSFLSVTLWLQSGQVSNLHVDCRQLILNKCPFG